ARLRRPRAGPPRSFGPGPSGGVRDRRRGCGPRRKGGDGSGYRPGRQANGPLCRPAHRGGRGGEIFACAVSVSAAGGARPQRAAVVKFGNLRLTGFIGWLFWSLAHIYFLIGVKNRFIVAFTWLWDYVTFHRGARLITEVPPPGRA